MQTLHIHTADSTYPIHIGALPRICHAGKVLLVSNPKVAGLYLAEVLASIRAKEVYVCIIPDGEQYKNMQSVEYILECAFSHRLDRKSLMIALGGGVVGDMVGFVSGIYQRGIEFIQIPTTLLSQVDASVGGKTGINNAFGKNLIGLFHQPSAVYINPRFLSSLSAREFGAGVAEMIKMAVCFDREFFEHLQTHTLSAQDIQTLSHAISRAVSIKAEVVGCDEKERGVRAALNYGHTFGHVIENLTGYRRYLHGEAVSIGMCMANALACELGLLSKEEAQAIGRVLASYGLPVSFEIDDVAGFYDKFYLDKKSADSKIVFVLPQGIGHFALCDALSKESVLKILGVFHR